MENVQLIKSPIPFIMMLVYIAVVMVMAWYQGFSKMDVSGRRIRRSKIT